MINQDFQDLKRRWGINSEERDNILSEMRDNLLSRNNGESIYVFQYTQPGKEVDITSDSVKDLFAVDGDINPLNK